MTSSHTRCGHTFTGFFIKKRKSAFYYIHNHKRPSAAFNRQAGRSIEPQHLPSSFRSSALACTLACARIALVGKAEAPSQVRESFDAEIPTVTASQLKRHKCFAVKVASPWYTYLGQTPADHSFPLPWTSQQNALTELFTLFNPAMLPDFQFRHVSQQRMRRPPLSSGNTVFFILPPPTSRLFPSLLLES